MSEYKLTIVSPTLTTLNGGELPPTTSSTCSKLKAPSLQLFKWPYLKGGLKGSVQYKMARCNNCSNRDNGTHFQTVIHQRYSWCWTCLCPLRNTCVHWKREVKILLTLTPLSHWFQKVLETLGLTSPYSVIRSQFKHCSECWQAPCLNNTDAITSPGQICPPKAQRLSSC